MQRRENGNFGVCSLPARYALNVVVLLAHVNFVPVDALFVVQSEKGSSDLALPAVVKSALLQNARYISQASCCYDLRCGIVAEKGSVTKPTYTAIFLLSWGRRCSGGERRMPLYRAPSAGKCISLDNLKRGRSCLLLFLKGWRRQRRNRTQRNKKQTKTDGLTPDGVQAVDARLVAHHRLVAPREHGGLLRRHSVDALAVGRLVDRLLGGGDGGGGGLRDHRRVGGNHGARGRGDRRVGRRDGAGRLGEDAKGRRGQEVRRRTGGAARHEQLVARNADFLLFFEYFVICGGGAQTRTRGRGERAKCLPRVLRGPVGYVLDGLWFWVAKTGYSPFSQEINIGDWYCDEGTRWNTSINHRPHARRDTAAGCKIGHLG